MTLPQDKECLTLSVPDAAQKLGVSKTLMWDLIYQGKIPIVRLGRRVLVPRQTLDDIVASATPGGRDPSNVL